MTGFSNIDAPQPPTDSVRWELRIGVVVIALFFGLFLGWAALAPLDAGAVASGEVAVTGNRQSVQHRDGGVIQTLAVSEGDRVQKGQVLLQLSAGELRASERGIAGQVFALLAQRSRLLAERDRLPILSRPPEFDILEGNDLALANEALRLQQRQFGARGAGRLTQTGVLNQRVEQLREQMAGYQRQIDANDKQQSLIDEELIGLRSLADRGYAPLTRVRALERSAAALEGEQGSLRARVAQTQEQIGEARLQTLGVTTELDEDVADQLRQVEVQLNELRPRLEDLKAQISRTEVRSPATGQVVGLSIFTEGGVVQPGQLLMDVVPDRAEQVIVAKVAPVDIDNLTVGLKTEVQFPGLRERNLETLRGHVRNLSADRFIDEATGASYFRAEIVVPAAELKKIGSSAQSIRAGTPAEVVILTRKRTMLAYLFEPLAKSLWRSGKEQ